MKSLVELLIEHRIPYWIKDDGIAVPFQAMKQITEWDFEEICVHFELDELWIQKSFFDIEITPEKRLKALECWQSVLDIIEYVEGMVMPEKMDDLVKLVQKKQHCSKMQANSWIDFQLKSRILNPDTVSTGFDHLDAYLNGFCKGDVIVVVSKQRPPYWKYHSNIDINEAKLIARQEDKPVLIHKKKLSSADWKADMILIMQYPCIDEVWCFVVLNHHGPLCEVLLKT